MKRCTTCIKDFTPWPHNPDQRYCSRPCWAIGKRRQVSKTCETCGTVFSVYQARRKARFCSWRCRKQQIKKTCRFCGASFYEKPSQADKRKTCSRSCLMKLRAAEGRHPHTGRPKSAKAREHIAAGLRRFFAGDPTKHWHYQGGHTNRRGQSWATQRIAARERDGHRCLACGITEARLGKKLSVHHVIPFRRFATAAEANELKNLVSVCQPCHMRIEHGKINMPTPAC